MKGVDTFISQFIKGCNDFYELYYITWRLSNLMSDDTWQKHPPEVFCKNKVFLKISKIS